MNVLSNGKMIAMWSCAALSLFFAAPASASILFSMQPAIASAGSSNVTFDVLISNDGPTSVTVGGFAFEILVGSADITFTGASDGTTTAPYIFAGNSSFAPLLGTSPPGQTMDVSDNVFTPFSGTVLAAGSTFGLGLISFDVSPAAINQILAVTFNQSNSSLASDTGDPITIDTFLAGSITITDVPEPATVGLVGLTLAGCAALRYRKRQKLSA